MKKPVLTISILCSGRLETEKCLRSLEKLREEVLCELILTDTGCSARQRRLLERYADKLLSFCWCNDFSKARNAGMEAAGGEWFLYLDDDEWFEDCGEIISFFKKGEYKKYGCASYIQRNYMNEAGSVYTDARVTRMTSLKRRPRFKGCIHEYLEPLEEPQKYLNAGVAHYGYCFKSEEEALRRSERNISLLREMLKKERHEIRWWGQLVQEYVSIKKYDEMEKLCRDGLLEFENEDNEYCNIHRGGLYCGIVEAERRLGRPPGEALSDCAAGLQDKRIGRKSQARLYGLGTRLCYEAGEYEKGAGYCKKYLKLYGEWEKRGSIWKELETFSARIAFEAPEKEYAVCYGILNELKTGKSGLLHEYLKGVDWDVMPDYGAVSTIAELIGVTAERGEYSYLRRLMEALIKKGFSLYENMDRENASEAAEEICTAYYQEARALQKMLSAEDADHWAEFGKAVKEALGVFPQFQDVLKAYAGVYAERRAKAIHSQESAAKKRDAEGACAEIQALSARIKAQIPLLLSQGMEEQALQIMEQLKKLAPGDEEAEEMEREIKKVILAK